MDKDRVKGMANQAKGAAKQAAGSVKGDAKLKAEGKAQKTAGKVQSAVGGMKDHAQEIIRMFERLRSLSGGQRIVASLWAVT
jgi:uncharacterized protein YjbJ (UPF0337 family)